MSNGNVAEKTYMALYLGSIREKAYSSNYSAVQYISFWLLKTIPQI
jgi:hypothetical protein